MLMRNWSISDAQMLHYNAWEEVPVEEAPVTCKYDADLNRIGV